MLKRFLGFLIIATLSFIFSLNIFAENLTIAGTNWEPYSGEKLDNNGFFTEIVETAFEKAGYTTSYQTYPWNRAVNLVQTGKSDILSTVYKSPEREKTMYFSDSVVESTIVFFKKTEKNIFYETLSDLRPYTIGSVRGYAYTPEYDSADFLKKDESTDDLSIIKKVFAGRVDLGLVDRFTGIYLIHTQHPIAKGYIDIIEKPLVKKDVYIAISKKVQNYKQIINDFNKGLKALKDSGEYEAIQQKHGF